MQLNEATRENDKLKDDKKVPQRKVQCMADKLKNGSPEVISKRGRANAKSFEDLSDRQQRRLKRQRTGNCCDSLGWLELEGYTPIKLEVRNNRTGMTETLALDRETALNLFGHGANSLTDDQKDTISMMLYVKDRYNVSNDAYHEMSRICRSMPRQYCLKQRIAELNKLWNIKPTPNGVVGVQQSLEDRLRVRITHLHKTASADAKFRTTKTVNVKLSGDGTNIGKRLHIVNFTFTLLEEGRLAYSSDGNHTLAIFKEAEKYEHLRHALQDICIEVESLQMIIVDGQTYKINYYLGGDWKFLALITGIDSASSRYACIWCKCPSEERCKMDKFWSVTDTALGARSIQENVELSSLPKSKKKYNVSRLPLFPTIPLQNVVI